MKVFIINVVCGKGSTGHIVQDLYDKILSAGNDAYIAYGRGEAPQEIHSGRIGSRLDVLIHAGLSRITDKQGDYSVRATKKLVRKIRSYAPDLIHLHNIHGYYINYKILFDFLRQYGKPVIWTMHDCWAFTGHCAHYEGVMCEGWLSGCRSCKALFTYPKAYINCNTGKNYENKKKAFLIPRLTLVTPSLWLKNQLARSFFYKVPCVVINNGINLETFQFVGSDIKKKLGISDKKMILGVAYVWTKFKGFEDLIELAKKLDSEYVICMIGLSRQQLKNLPDRIIGMERTDGQAELVEYYSAADVFLNLTYEDTFPTINIEALACGTPVITYRTGGSAEIIDDTCGAAVEKRDFSSIIHEISIWTNKECGKECRERAMRYAKEDCFQKYMELYAESINKLKGFK